MNDRQRERERRERRKRERRRREKKTVTYLICENVPSISFHFAARRERERGERGERESKRKLFLTVAGGILLLIVFSDFLSSSSCI